MEIGIESSPQVYRAALQTISLNPHLMQTHHPMLGTAAVFLLLAAALHAAPIAVEAFNGSTSGYPAGLEGVASGSGWSGAWKEFSGQI